MLKSELQRQLPLSDRFFKNARQEWLFLSKLAQNVLGILYSPTVAERVFLKQGTYRLDDGTKS